MLPIHLAAMQGRVEVIKLLLKKDVEKQMVYYLSNKSHSDNQTDSLVYLSMLNNHLECAFW